jgi:hypothetical protein
MPVVQVVGESLAHPRLVATMVAADVAPDTKPEIAAVVCDGKGEA